ncbi:MAG: hypothetical protein P8103_10190 [Candidatus Thiodiazotropha sp.]
MKKVLIIILLVGGAYHFWNKYNADKLSHATPSPNGFVEVIMPSGTTSHKVYILAPQNCPKEAGQRADALERELKRRGVPVERSSKGSVSARNISEEEKSKFSNTVEILNGTIPAVFVNGMAKTNPDIEEIIAEYRRTN